jgi:biotin transport system permease protein
MLSLISERETWLHPYRAGHKFGLLLAFMVLLFAAQNLWAQGVFLGIVLAVHLSCGRDFTREALSHLKPLWPFVLIVLIWHIATQDIENGVIILLRVTTAFLAAGLVTMTTRLEDMTDFVMWLLTPLERFGVNTRAIAVSIALVIRFVPVLLSKARSLIESWRSRSAKRVHVQLLAPMALIAIDDAEHVAEALRARGGLN